MSNKAVAEQEIPWSKILALIQGEESRAQTLLPFRICGGHTVNRADFFGEDTQSTCSAPALPTGLPNDLEMIVK